MASASFNIAIVGAGGIANAHVGAAEASKGRVKVVAVVDTHEGNRNALAGKTGAKAFASMKDLLGAAKGLELGGVVVCTPPSARIEIVEGAIGAGLAVLSEKPLAHTAADAQRLADVAAKNPRVFTAVAYCHRFAPPVVAIKKLIADGKIGRLTRFENVFACDLPGHETKWMSEPKAAGGGAFIDMGCHSLDLFHFTVGPSRVRGAVFDHAWSGRTESGASVLVSATSGVSANINAGVAGFIASGWAETERFTVAYVGTKGMLAYDYVKPTELVFKDLVAKTEVIPVESHDVRFAKQLVAFADAAQHGTKSDLATFAEGVLAAQAVEAAAGMAR